MMDGNALGGFSCEKHSSSESLFPSSTIYDSTATTFDNILEVKQSGPDSSIKKKKVSKIISGGLCELSVIVCKKVETKGRTTYSEVADEIIAKCATRSNISKFSLDKFDEKNIRRRVYDALNVFMALDIITKDTKEIRWRGLPGINVKDMAATEVLCAKLMTSIAKKVAYLRDLKQQITGLQNLILRNQLLLKSGKPPSQGFYLPLILVQTAPHATVEIEISEDMQLVHFDFNSTPFTLHDDAYILQLMRCYDSRHVSRSPSVLSSSSSSDVVSGSMKAFHWNSEVDTPK